jgi:hypothetical protein
VRPGGEKARHTIFLVSSLRFSTTLSSLATSLMRLSAKVICACAVSSKEVSTWRYAVSRVLHNTQYLANQCRKYLYRNVSPAIDWPGYGSTHLILTVSSVQAFEGSFPSITAGIRFALFSVAFFVNAWSFDAYSLSSAARSLMSSRT